MQASGAAHQGLPERAPHRIVVPRDSCLALWPRAHEAEASPAERRANSARTR